MIYMPDPPYGQGAGILPPPEANGFPWIPDVPFSGWLFSPTASGWIAFAIALLWLSIQARRPRPIKVAEAKGSQEKTNLETKLTYLVAIVVAAVSAQGMGKFFIDKLGFPLLLVIVCGGLMELTAFVCGLRARQNIRDPQIAKAGVDGIAVWVVAALSGVFSAMDADSFEVALFRFVMPLLAAWLWERGMSIERQKIRSGKTINLRVTPERILVWMRIAEPTGRTASEVDAHRRITALAKAAKRLRRLQSANVRTGRIERAERKLDRKMTAAVAHAGLATSTQRQSDLLAQIGLLYNAAHLPDLKVDAPWTGLVAQPPRTWFEAKGLTFSPAELTRPASAHAPVPQDLSDLLTAHADRTQNETPDRTADRSPVLSERSADRTGTAVLDRSPDRTTDRTTDRTSGRARVRTETGRRTVRQTGPRKVSKNGTDHEALLAQAEEINAKHVAKHGKNIPVDDLRSKLRCAKPTATALMQTIRGAATAQKTRTAQEGA